MRNLLNSLTLTSWLGALAVFVLGIGYAQVSRADLQNGLVSCYHFDETNGTVAYDSVGGINGAANMSSVFTTAVAGVSGQCADLSCGNDYIQYDSTFGITTGDFTVSMWVNVRTFLSDKLIWNKYDNTDHTAFWIQTTSSNTLAFSRNNYNIGSTGTVNTRALETNRWYHITYAINRTGGTGAVYLNGSLVGVGNISVGGGHNDYPSGTRLGDYVTYSNIFYDGLIDEFKIWNRLLTGEEIYALANEFGPKFNYGLLAYYPFDGNANDASGNGYGATLHNTASYVGGFSNQAVYLQGRGDIGTTGDYVTMPGFDLAVRQAFSVSMWVKQDGSSCSSDSGDHYISFGNPAATTFGIGYSGTPWSFNYGGRNSAVTSSMLGTEWGNWVHHAVVFSNGFLSAYKNGILVGTTNGVSVGTITQGGLGISWNDPTQVESVRSLLGVSPPLDTTRFVGAIDEVRIYSRALSGEEIQDLYGIKYVMPPDSIAASDGDVFNQIMVSWKTVPGSSSYLVWKSVDNDVSTASLVATLTTTNFVDVSVSCGQTNWYWIQTVGNAATSVFSQAESGWAGEGVKIVVEGEPSRIGVPTPLGYGTNIVMKGRYVTNSVEACVVVVNAVRDICTGFSGSGSVSNGGSNAVVFVSDTDSTLTWKWQRQSLLTVSNALGGSVDPAGGWYATNSLVVLTATPSNGWMFLRWEGDVSGTVTTNTTLTLSMESPRSMKPVFLSLSQDSDNDGMPDWWELKYGLNPNSPQPWGRGGDGNLTVATGQTNFVDSVKRAVSGVNPAGTNRVNVESTNGFKTADAVLIIAMQDPRTDMSQNVAGQYEFNRVTGTAAGALVLETPLSMSFDVVGGQKIQVIRVPEYNNLTVSGTVTCAAWDGTVGGVLAFRAKSLTVATNGVVSASGKGFRGGSDYALASSTGFQGESYCGAFGVRATTANYSGGGGGGYSTSGYSGHGGGGGGFASVGEKGYRSDVGEPGEGGNTVGSSMLLRLYLGGAGGSGGQDGSDSAYDSLWGDGRGGNGGSLIVIQSGTITNNAVIIANGQNGFNGVNGTERGGGGGGSGGSVVIVAKTYTGAGTVQATGGTGGLGSAHISGTQTLNRGGTGGVGRIRFDLPYTNNIPSCTPAVGYVGTVAEHTEAAYDPDGDGFSNICEFQFGTDPTRSDTDDDGMPDGWEVENGLNPLVNDAAGDADGDGLKNIDELKAGTKANVPDSDNDGLSDGEEMHDYGTDPLKKDTDGDGMEDGWEVVHGFAPLANEADGDRDLDGITNGEEIRLGLDPTRACSSGDGIDDYRRVYGKEYTHYTYDKIDRLVGAEYSRGSNGLSISYTYDGNGNILRQLYLQRDQNGNGLPDIWEYLNGLSVTNTAAGGVSADADGDGWTNYQEWQAGTNPRDAASVPDLAGVAGVTGAVFQAGFAVSNFVMAVGQLDAAGAEEIVIGADGNPDGATNRLSVLWREGYGWRTESVDVGPYGVTSVTIAQPTNTAQAAIYLGLRSFDSTGVVMRVAKEGGIWTNSMIAFDTSVPSNRLANGSFEYGADGTTNAAAIVPLGWSGTFSNLVRTAADTRSGLMSIGVTNLGTKVFSETAWQWVDASRLPLGKDLAFQCYVNAYSCQQSLTNGLIDYYLLDEVSGSTAFDWFGRNDLSHFNGVLIAQTGIISNACDYSGANNRYSEKANPTGLSDVDFSGSAWVCLTSADTYDQIIRIWDDSPDTCFEILFGSPTQLQIMVYDGVTEQASVDFSPFFNKWTHIAWICTSNRLALYINGEQKIDIGISFARFSGALHSMILGNADYRVRTRALNGRIDEVGIWGRVLKPDEILALYNGSSGHRPIVTGHAVVPGNARMTVEWWDATNGTRLAAASSASVTNTGGRWTAVQVVAARTNAIYRWAKCVCEVNCTQTEASASSILFDDVGLYGDYNWAFANVGFVLNSRESPSLLLSRMDKTNQPVQSLYRLDFSANNWCATQVDTNAALPGTGSLFVSQGLNPVHACVASALADGSGFVSGLTSPYTTNALSRALSSSPASWSLGVATGGDLRRLTNGVSIVWAYQEADGCLVLQEQILTATSAFAVTATKLAATGETCGGMFGLTAVDLLGAGRDVLFTGEPDGRVFEWTAVSNAPLKRTLFNGQYAGKTWSQMSGYRDTEANEWLLGLSVDPTNASSCNLIAWAPQTTLWAPPVFAQTAPRVTVVPSPNSGVERATVRVRVADSEGNPTVPELHYQRPGESVWQAATVVQGDGQPLSGMMPSMLSAATGIVHELVWDCRADLGGRFVSNVLLRVRGRDVTLTGTWSDPVSYQVTVLPWYTVTVSAGANGSVVPSGTLSVMEGVSTTLVALADAGYHVSSVTVDGAATNCVGLGGAEAFLTLDKVCADHDVVFAFEVNLPTLTVGSEHGTPDPEVGVHSYPQGTQVTNRVAGVDEAGDTRYRCTGWTLAGGTPAAGMTNAFVTTITHDAVLAWLWETDYRLSATAQGLGTVTGGTEWYVAGSVAHLVAAADAHAKFIRFEGDLDGAAVAGNTADVLMDWPRSIIAVFEPDMYSLAIYSAHGGCVPEQGTNAYAWGTPLLCSVTNASVLDGAGLIRYDCVGWTGTGSVTNGTGTNCPVVVKEDSAILWQWKTNYWLAVSAQGHGAVSGTNGWVEAGTNIVLTVNPEENYHLAGWSGDTNGCSIVGNQLVAPMTLPRSLTAVFVGDNRSLTVFSERGTASPGAGVHVIPYGTTVTCSVGDSPVVMGTTQYVCTGWSGLGDVPGSGGTTNVAAFAIAHDSAVAWTWRPEYRLDTEAVGFGEVNVADSWIKSGNMLAVTASPKAMGVTFTGWTGDTEGCFAIGTQLIVTMDRPRRVVANFTSSFAARGTPTPWLQLYGLTNGTFDAEELTDVDGDGFAAWQEYLADTDPTNRLSRLELTEVRLVPGGAQVGWKGGVQASQWLEAKFNLGNTGEQWVAIFTNLPPTATSETILDKGATNAMRFYRIRATR